MKYFQAFIFAVTLCATTSSYAVVETNKTPTGAGVRVANNSAYFLVKEGLATACASNVIWITFDTAGSGKAAYATILAAQLAEKKLSYFEYTLNPNGNCYLVQASMAE